ncbi:unnamed protein product [Citrullus colocynthis]|uniref:Uncharacterized protein n=1 Tax=Citrullus colocynthis TaxID=252529 RepID=A0ABP0YFM4_9ROSI
MVHFTSNKLAAWLFSSLTWARGSRFTPVVRFMVKGSLNKEKFHNGDGFSLNNRLRIRLEVRARARGNRFTLGMVQFTTKVPALATFEATIPTFRESIVEVPKSSISLPPSSNGSTIVDVNGIGQGHQPLPQPF